MSEYTEDGGVIPAGVESYDADERSHKNHYGIYQASITSVIYPESPSSRSKEMIEYIVNIGGQNYPYAIDMRRRGGIYNHSERIMDETSTNLKGGRLSGETRDEDSNGEIVWVMFIEGNADFPLIVGSAQHPATRKDHKPTLLDGQYDLDVFNGVEFKIDKDSNYSIKHVGRKTPEGIIENPLGVDTEIKLSGNGDYEILVSDTVKIKITKATKKIELIAGSNTYTMSSTGIKAVDAAGNEINLAAAGLDIKAAAAMLLEAAANLTINATANVEIKATANAKLEGTAGTDVGSGASITNVKGSMVMLAGGGAPIARLGDMAVGTGFAGFPVITNLVQGSPKVTSG